MGTPFQYEYGGQSPQHGHSPMMFDDLNARFEQANLHGSGRQSSMGTASSSAISVTGKDYIGIKYVRNGQNWSASMPMLAEITGVQRELKKKVEKSGGATMKDLERMGNARRHLILDQARELTNQEVGHTCWEPAYIKTIDQEQTSGGRFGVKSFKVIFARRTRPREPEARGRRRASSGILDPEPMPSYSGLPRVEQLNRPHIDPYQDEIMFDEAGRPVNGPGVAPIPFSPVPMPFSRPLGENVHLANPPPPQPHPHHPPHRPQDFVEFEEVHEHEPRGRRPVRIRPLTIIDRAPSASGDSDNGSFVSVGWDENSSRTSEDTHYKFARHYNKKGHKKGSYSPLNEPLGVEQVIIPAGRERHTSGTNAVELQRGRPSTQMPIIHQQAPPMPQQSPIPPTAEYPDYYNNEPQDRHHEPPRHQYRTQRPDEFMGDIIQQQDIRVKLKELDERDRAMKELRAQAQASGNAESLTGGRPQGRRYTFQPRFSGNQRI